MNIDWALRVLNLERGCTSEDLKRAYRREAQRWHPDRYLSASSEEQADAVEQMKRVNVAYEFLSSSTGWKTRTQNQTRPRPPGSSAQSSGSTRQHSSTKNETYSQTRSTKAQPDASSASGSKVDGEKREETLFETMKNRKPTNQKATNESSSGWTRFAVWVVVIGVVAAVQSYNNQDAALVTVTPVADFSSPWVADPDLVELREQELDEADDGGEPEQVEEIPKVEFFDPRPFTSHNTEDKDIPIVSLHEYAPRLERELPEEESKKVDAGASSSDESTLTEVPGDYFTIGSSLDEVLAVMGTPRSIYGSAQSGTLSYGISSVSMSGGRVDSYSNLDGSLRVKLN